MNPGECRKLVEHLSLLGLDSLVELPQIAVMGDTSSGKSSLLSSLSGIEFPKRAGICTLCPTRVRMYRKEGPSAFEVSVQWNEQSTRPAYDIERGPVDNISSAISNAQEAILRGHDGETRFYKDIIDVKVSGPDYCDLTLVDLPGSVQTVGKGEDAQMINTIQEIMETYLKNDRCIILAVVQGTTNFRNSSIMRLAEEHDPDARRTMPVITKADRVEGGAENEVSMVVLGTGTRAQYKHGLHMVKLRSQEDVEGKVSIAASLDHEEAFFENHIIGGSGKTWSALIQRKDVLGVRNLTKRISAMFLELTKESTPEIIKEITSRLNDSENKLKSLGDTHTTEGDRRQAFDNLVGFAKEFLTSPQESGALYPKIVEAQVSEASAEFKQRLLASRLCQMQHNRKAAVEQLQAEVVNRRTTMPVLFPSMEHFADIVRQHITTEWKVAAEWYTDRVYKILEDTIDIVLCGCVAAQEPGRLGLRFMFNQKLQDSLKTSYMKAKIDVGAQIKMESKPSTQNDDLGKKFFSKQLETLKQSLVASLTTMEGTPATLAGAGDWRDVVLQRLLADLMPSKDLTKHAAEELYAAVVAYADVVLHRFADSIPMILKETVVGPFLTLEWTKRDMTDDVLLHAFQEDASVAAQRRLLTSEVERFTKAKNVVKKFAEARLGGES